MRNAGLSVGSSPCRFPRPSGRRLLTGGIGGGPLCRQPSHPMRLFMTAALHPAEPALATDRARRGG
ncbi:hypothetical protein EN779_36025, partial [Mesorhizobium sp. M4B.F.Ca.ET.088.02.2.1]